MSLMPILKAKSGEQLPAPMTTKTAAAMDIKLDLIDKDKKFRAEKRGKRTMKLCISSTKNDLEASADPRFGRCQYFLFVDTGTMNFEAAGNPAFTAGGGAGIQAAQLVVNKGADAVITGNVGPNAFQALQAAGVKIITGAQGPVRDVVERFNKGEYEYAASPSVETHYGARR